MLTKDIKSTLYQVNTKISINTIFVHYSQSDYTYYKNEYNFQENQKGASSHHHHHKPLAGHLPQSTRCSANSRATSRVRERITDGLTNWGPMMLSSPFSCAGMPSNSVPWDTSVSMTSKNVHKYKKLHNHWQQYTEKVQKCCALMFTQDDADPLGYCFLLDES